MNHSDGGKGLGNEMTRNEKVLEALRVAEQFMDVANDWNLHEVEIFGEMRSTYDWMRVIREAITVASGEAHE